jgi:NAD(P)-dependent dehydrogenase (short-subunit alcohol dehydrogenase family)
MPRDRRAIFAVLSAKVGSIADNRLGGWYSYRASKAALNQIVRTASVELRRSHPQAVCVAFHPGTVATRLSDGFAKTGLQVQTPRDAASDLLDSIDRLTPRDSGAFLDRFGQPIPW